MKLIKNCWLILLVISASCNTKDLAYRETIKLAGQWQFALDTLNEG